MKPNEPFKIRTPIGSPYNHDLDDVTRAKHALKDLGHFRTPHYGLTPYPDTPLFDGIKSYQRARGLDVDGIMKPGGPTAAEIGKDLSDKAPKFRRFETGTEPAGPGPVRGTAKAGGPPADGADFGTAFGIAGDIGWGRTNDPGDILAARRALAWAKQLPASKAKDQKSADNDLYQAIENFQSQAGVKKDGWMRPGGETANALNDAVAPKVRAYLGSKRAQDSGENKSDANSERQVAMAPAIPLLSQLGRLGLQHALKHGGKEALRSGSAAAAGAAAAKALNNEATPPAQGRSSQRTDIAEPPPPTPPHKPKEPEEAQNNGLPADPPEIPKLNGRPINEVIKTDPVIFEILSDAFRKELSRHLESHRGDDDTQWGLAEAIRILPKVLEKWGPDASERFEHKHGAIGSDTGEKKPEEYVPNRETGGRKGSSNPDLSWYDKKHDRWIRLNSGLMLKDGLRGIASERRQMEQLARNSGAADLVGFIQKYRPGMDRDAFREKIFEQLDEIFGGFMGPPMD